MRKDKTKPGRRGFFITFEGGEGAGKTTQRKKLVSALKRLGFNVVLTREPGGSRIGKKIRSILLNPDHDEMVDRAEVLLYEADRAQNFAQIILPALERGDVVISDRSAHSSTVYQGICRGLGIKEIEALNRFATQDQSPDLVILLDVPVNVSAKRLKARRGLDRLEQESRKFHEKVRKGFLLLSRRHRRQFKVIDATQSPETVFAEVESAVFNLLAKSRAK